MPRFSQHNPERLIKALYLGDSGAGKTGSLASIINNPQATGIERTHIWDFDNGLDVLAAFLKPEAMERVYYKTLTDKLSPGSKGPVRVGVPKAFSTAMQAFQKWKEEGEDLGGVFDWGPEVLVVVDSLTFLGEAAMRYTLALNERPVDEREHPGDWGDAMKRQEGVLALLYTEQVKCHVIVTSHIYHPTRKETKINPKTGKEQLVEVEAEKGMPSALGNKLPPKIGRYFNTTLRAVSVGGNRRRIRTVSDGEVDLKNPLPTAIPHDFPLESGMGDFFKIVRGL